MSVEIKSTLYSHLLNVAQCHAAAFPNSLATALGRHYVVNMLSWYLSTDKAFLFHLEDMQGQCIGYCGGIVRDGSLGVGSASSMAQHTFKAAIWAFLTHPWVLLHPELREKWPLLWKNFKMKLGLSKRIHFSLEQKAKMVKEPSVGLVVIGVNPAYHGQRYGSLLLREFERWAVEVYGIRMLSLSVLATNVKAIKAYERNGWVKSEERGKSISMVKTVS